MNLNPDTTKQAQKVIFSRKVKKAVHPPLLFNNASVTRTSSLKHLAIILDDQLKFEDHIEMLFRKISKTKVFFVNCIIFYQELHLSQYIKLLSDIILVMVISFMIKRIICLFTKSWNPFSIMHAWPLPEPYEALRKKSLTKKYV